MKERGGAAGISQIDEKILFQLINEDLNIQADMLALGTFLRSKLGGSWGERRT